MYDPAARLLLSIAVSLVLTIALELPLLYILGMRGRRNGLLIVLVNIMTNPAVAAVCILTKYALGKTALWILLAAECTAWLAEGRCYRKYADGIRHPYLLSAAANLFSYWSGELLQRL